MRQLHLECGRPEWQLAVDEALLLAADEAAGPERPRIPGAGTGTGTGKPIASGTEWFRVWRFDSPTVVIGRSSKIEREVDLDYCRDRGIPVLRRCSGGAAVVGGPGCLMYSLVLSLDLRPPLQKIDAAHRFVMERLRNAAARQLDGVRFQGICDLTWRDRKFSGNSLRVGRRHLLYHGTVLHDADLELIDRCLVEAPRQPDYRRGRSHRDFVVNVPVDPQALAEDFAAELGVSETGRGLDRSLNERVGELERERYSRAAWHHRH